MRQMVSGAHTVRSPVEFRKHTGNAELEAEQALVLRRLGLSALSPSLNELLFLFAQHI